MDSFEIRKKRLANIIEFNIQLIKMNYFIYYNYKQQATELNYSEVELNKLEDIKINDLVSDTWLNIPRIKHLAPPLADDKDLIKYIKLSNDYKTTPELNLIEIEDKILQANQNIAELELQDKEPNKEKIADLKQNQKSYDQEIKSLHKKLQSYIVDKWEKWAEIEKEKAKTGALYNKLYNLRADSNNETDFELIWGCGIVSWLINGKEICYPLIAVPMEVVLEKGTFALHIVPQEAHPTLELDILDEVSPSSLQKLTQYFNQYIETNSDISPFNINSFLDVVNFAVGNLDSKGEYYENNLNRVVPDPSENLKITDTWVLFKRRKSQHIIINDLERLKNKVLLADEIVGAINNLISEPLNIVSNIQLGNYRGLSSTSNSENIEVNELYFPLTYNEEQVKIIQLLDKYNGVVVQGPPGTGKTHTIANIICHHLALGQRVLVTSMGAHALSVIQDKLPEEINDLVISLVSDDRHGLKQFEKSVTNIANNVQQINPNEYINIINGYLYELDKLHSQIALIDNQLTRIAEQNTNDIKVDNESFNIYKATQFVFEGDDINWPIDEITIEHKYNILFSTDDIAKLKVSKLIVGNKLNYLNIMLPTLESLPDLQNLYTIHVNLLSREQILQNAKEGKFLQFINENSVTIDLAKESYTKIQNLIQDMSTLNSDAPWWINFINNVTADNEALLNHLELSLGKEITELEELRKAFVIQPIYIPNNYLEHPELTAVIRKLAIGKKTFSIFGKKKIKELISQITISKKQPNSASDWEHVLAFINVEVKFMQVKSSWDSIASELGIAHAIPSIDIISSIKELNRIYKLILTIKNINYRLQTLKDTWLQIFNQNLSINLIKNTILSELNLMLQNLEVNIRYSNLKVSELEKFNIVNGLSAYSAPVITSFISLLNNVVGTDLYISKEDFSNILNEIREEISLIHNLEPHFKVLQDISNKIEASGAPIEANNLRSSVECNIPDNWQTQWCKRRLNTHFKNSDSFLSIKQIYTEREQIIFQMANTYKKLVAQKSWLKIYENLTPKVKSALNAFAAAIRAIGKGTGQKANYWRGEASNSAKNAVSGVPCWIMPHYKIAEHLPAKLGDFDLVIIDEASQSDFSAFPALLRAKKILVVGDDKQVSPDNVGLQINKVQQIRNSVLVDQVEQFKAQLTPERSIYDLFKVVFADSTIMLKEHFRCVSPIIEFSKKHFYNDQLIPLRLPKPSERLDPPLIDVYIKDGYRDAYKRNKNEAKFIIEEIKLIIKDEAFKNKTIGVVSLLGDKQAKLIYDSLIDEISIEEYGKHDIVCGDARTFQGKEKDIIFLSLVASKGENKSPLATTRESFQQRYNVATSRARDRMYLVRSVTLADLSPGDELRRSLLEHFSVPDQIYNNEDSNLVNLCESEFEKDLYLFLLEKGYPIIPQLKVGNFRIDMVIEDANNSRLAIECDGDKYHGPEKWDYDMRRQRVLERAGWKFWRCFASHYYQDKNLCQQDLITTLEMMNIKPQHTAVRSNYINCAYREYTISSETV